MYHIILYILYATYHLFLCLFFLTIYQCGLVHCGNCKFTMFRLFFCMFVIFVIAIFVLVLHPTLQQGIQTKLKITCRIVSMFPPKNFTTKIVTIRMV